MLEFSLCGGSTCPTTNLAQGRTATASSQESAAFPAASAVDGNASTRWSSAFTDPSQRGYSLWELQVRGT